MLTLSKNSRMWFEIKKHIEVLGGKLKLAGKDVLTIAEEFTTPIYVTNLTRIKKTYLKVNRLLIEHSVNNIQPKLYYAIKANSASEILELLDKENAFFEVSSTNELKKLIELGIQPDRIQFTGIGFGLHNVDYIANSGALLNIDSFSQLELFKEYAPMDISIRFNPGISSGYNKKLEMAGSNKGAGKLGIHSDRIEEIFELAKAYGFNPIGFHQHIGSNWFEDKLPLFLEASQKSIDTVINLKKKGFNISTLNFGGGLGVKSNQEMQDFPLKKYVKSIWELIEKSDVKLKHIAIEPGRYIVADSTLLLATANMVEEKGGDSYIGLDCGFNTFNHKFLYNIEPEIINISRLNNTEKEEYNVVGYLGESGDIFAENKKLPKTLIGDTIAIYPAGAYCASELADFHLQELPTQLFIESEEKPFDIFPYCKVCPRNCCYIGDVFVLDKEYEKIIERTGRVDVFRKKENYHVLTKKKGEPCPFLEKDGVTCSIQDIKPLDCKAWPVYFGVNGDIDKNTISKECPANSFLSNKFIEKSKVALEEIPIDLRKVYYEETIKIGYELE